MTTNADYDAAADLYEVMGVPSDATAGKLRKDAARNKDGSVISIRTKIRQGIVPGRDSTTVANPLIRSTTMIMGSSSRGRQEDHQSMVCERTVFRVSAASSKVATVTNTRTRTRSLPAARTVLTQNGDLTKQIPLPDLAIATRWRSESAKMGSRVNVA